MRLSITSANGIAGGLSSLEYMRKPSKRDATLSSQTITRYLFELSVFPVISRKVVRKVPGSPSGCMRVLSIFISTQVLFVASHANVCQPLGEMLSYPGKLLNILLYPSARSNRFNASRDNVIR